MSLVLDGSVVLAWCFDDEVTPAIDDLMRHVARNGAVVPAIWHLEVANGLRTALRKQRLTTGRRDELMDVLKLLPIEPDTERPGRLGRRPFSCRTDRVHRLADCSVISNELLFGGSRHVL
ncbi:type II toxin-antitoxin system VapC family toxin [Tistrella mobilis]|uniref:type II toxin-antitoxin system VapC family toxin n=1 Tax=Tistrella mobilis TaxID=171437 RepID=UPI003555DDBC